MTLPIQHQPWDCSQPIEIGGITYRLETDYPQVTRDGNRLWPTSIALVSEIAKRGGQLGRAVDLGCGLGLVGIVASRSSYEILFVERDYETIKLASKNVDSLDAYNRIMNANFTSSSWDVCDWKCDSIFGSEILYRSYGIAGIADFVSRNWTRRGPCLFANSLDSGSGELLEALMERKLAVTKGFREFTLPNGETFSYFLWEIHP